MGAGAASFDRKYILIRKRKDWSFCGCELYDYDFLLERGGCR